jgi:hypothetical protein
MRVRMSGCDDPRVSRGVRHIQCAKHTKDFVLYFGIAPSASILEAFFGDKVQSYVLNDSWCVQPPHASAKPFVYAVLTEEADSNSEPHSN